MPDSVQRFSPSPTFAVISRTYSRQGTWEQHHVLVHFAHRSYGLKQLAGALRGKVSLAVWKHAKAASLMLPDRCVHHSVKPLLPAPSAACWQPVLLVPRYILLTKRGLRQLTRR